MSLRAQTTDFHLEDVCMAHVKKLSEDFVLITWDKAQLVISVVKGDCITIVLVVFFSHKFESCSDFQFLECIASIPIHKSSNVAVKEMLPLFCSLFHNPKSYFVISENKGSDSLSKNMAQVIKLHRNNS